MSYELNLIHLIIPAHFGFYLRVGHFGDCFNAYNPFSQPGLIHHLHQFAFCFPRTKNPDRISGADHGDDTGIVIAQMVTEAL